MSWMAYFILRARIGTGVSLSQHRTNSGEVLAPPKKKKKKNAGEWTGRVEIRKEEIPGSRRSMHGFILTSPGFKGRTFGHGVVLSRWDLNFCVCSFPQWGKPGMERKGTNIYIYT